MASVDIKNVSISIPLVTQSDKSLRYSLLRKNNIQNIEILNNINIFAKDGDRIGIYGPNGSGKTSLLRLIIGAYPPTFGFISTSGNVQNMIDLNLGFDYEASGLKNIHLKIGLSAPKLLKNNLLIKKIISFSGLKESIFWPLKTYSSGMVMRLAFSIAINLQSDILVLDEWLSVGDNEFSEKAENVLMSKVKDSKILFLASHNYNLLTKVCNRILILENGKILMKNIFEAYKIFFMDLLSSISHYNFWLAYSAQDIKNKYTRSIIGPFWNTITIGLIILVVGPLYGIIFGNSGDDYYLHFGIGIIFWNFISSTISDSTLLFISESSYLKQTALSPLIHIIRMISRNTIIFFHNLILVILLYFLFNDFHYDSMLIFISFPLLIILLFLICFLCAIITLRFRDFGPLVSNITQLGLFLTPIFWVQSNDVRSLYLLLNPFNYMLDITRGCFNGQFKISSLLMIFLLTLLLFNLSVFVYYKFRKRIVYWI